MVPGLFALYMYALLKVILFKFGSINIPFLWGQLSKLMADPGRIMNRLQLANFTPFLSISRNIHNQSSLDLINLVGNIVIFMPFGIFLAISGNRRISFMGVLIRAFGFSLFLECSQIIFSIGSFDVDDLILNTTGALLGYGVYRVYGKYIKSSADQNGTRVTGERRA
ncbi:VanZ family protein [Paenibacillus sp. HN-1]|nr:VanZ family protein [Paenibacillus sp. CGMCC 1.18879]MBY9088077.1 VanZ family protein [Paenibacillus sinensis]